MLTFCYPFRAEVHVFSNTKRGHLYFAETGHYYLALTHLNFP